MIYVEMQLSSFEFLKNTIKIIVDIETERSQVRCTNTRNVVLYFAL